MIHGRLYGMRRSLYMRSSSVLFLYSFSFLFFDVPLSSNNIQRHMPRLFISLTLRVFDSISAFSKIKWNPRFTFTIDICLDYLITKIIV